MGRIDHGVVGKVTGQVGPVVFYEVEGRNFVRTRPQRTVPPSEHQQKVRLGFGGASRFITRTGNSIVRSIWDLSGPGKYGQARFCGVNQSCFDPQGTIVDFDRLVLSKGCRTPDLFQALPGSQQDQIRLVWSGGRGASMEEQTDHLHYFVLTPTQELIHRDTEIPREQGEAEVILGQEGLIHLYLFFASPSLDGFSNDFHLSLSPQ